MSVHSGQPVKKIALKENLTCLDFLPNDKQVVIGDTAGDMFIVEVKEWWSQLVVLMGEKKGAIGKVKMNPRKMQLLSVGEGGEMVQWGV